MALSRVADNAAHNLHIRPGKTTLLSNSLESILPELARLLPVSHSIYRKPILTQKA